MDIYGKHLGKVAHLAIAHALLYCSNTSAYAQTANGDRAAIDGAASTSPASASGEIVVTARKRTETLTSVPVSVAVLTNENIVRNRADDLTRIGELAPGIIVGTTQSTGGSSIAIRGVSTPATTAGFDQAVSVVIDAVQTSNGRVGQLGFFDIAQVEVLKGPQALFFGKNSPAGVISIKTAMPTDEFVASLRSSYEFVADQTSNEIALSGPLATDFKGRVALRYRKSAGWLYNDAIARPNPFYIPTAPAGAVTLPGASDQRIGDETFQGRVTLVYEPTPDISAVLKVYGENSRTGGSGTASQVIGCPGAHPVTSGVPDLQAECLPNNHLSTSDIPPALAQAMQRADPSGKQFGKVSAWIGSLALNGRFDDINVSMTTGYNFVKPRGQFGFDQSAFSQLVIIESATVKEFSQEIRVSSDFSGPFNFVAGAYYQNSDNKQYNDVKFSDRGYNPNNGRADTFEALSRSNGKTYSFFGQALYKFTPQLELAAGARWTLERKRFIGQSLYGVGVFDVSATVFPGATVPGQFNGFFKDKNISPEATITWRPTSDFTLYAAYKTGYKSGGFIFGQLQKTTTVADLDFGPEKVTGGEIGAKLVAIDRRLRVNATAFLYDFKGLQVSVFDPVSTRYVVNNAGLLKQRGIDLDATFHITPNISLHGAMSYVRNRYDDFIGQCYTFSFPSGTTVATATPPSGCSLVSGAGLTLQQVYDGRAPARSPTFSSNLGSVFTIPVGQRSIELTGDGFYSSAYYGSDNLNPVSRQSAFWRINAGVALRAEDDSWRVSLSGRNLTNKYYVLFSADRVGGASQPGSGSDVRAVVSRGREIALEAAIRF